MPDSDSNKRLANSNPRIDAPFSQRTMRLLIEVQKGNKAYRCKDPRHKQPLAVSREGLLCRECKYVQKWSNMFLDELLEDSK